MKWSRIVVATGLGIVAGYFLKDQIDQLKSISPEKALKIAKEAFKEQGPISGSWIYMQPEELQKNDLTYHVYRGGVTRTIDGENKQYEFYVDTNTATIIEVEQTS